MTLELGFQATFWYTVVEADTAVAVGSGEVPVCWPPRGVLALAERATVAAVAGAVETTGRDALAGRGWGRRGLRAAIRAAGAAAAVRR